MKTILGRIFAILFVVILSSSSLGIFNVKAGMLIPYPIEPNNDPPIITIETPTNKTYNTQNITLKFTITKPDTWTWSLTPSELHFDMIRKIRYFIDGKEKILFNNTRVADDRFPKVQYTSIELTNLTEGSHVLRIEVFTEHLYKPTGDLYTPHSVKYRITSSNQILFNIDATSPVVFVLSPKNKTYSDTEVLLTVEFEEEISNIKYSLDGLENVTITQDVTLSDLGVGKHNVTVYTTDLAGNIGVSETINFTIEPFPTTIVLTSLVIIVVGVGILAYFKKRRS